MRRRKVCLYIIPLFILITAIASVGEEDYPRSKDHPLVSRYPGSWIVHYSQKRFDEYYLLLGPVSGSDKGIQKARKKRLEGTVTRITYEGPRGRSNFEVYKNYELALKKAGFEILYRGRGNEIRGIYGFLERLNHEYMRGWDDPDEHSWYYLSAKTPSDTYFVSLYVHGSEVPVTVLAIVEPKSMETGLVTARMMKRQLAKTGKVALYGIYFDFDSAEIKPESKPTIEEVAKLLKNNPELKLYVVGHTDNTGGLEYNMGLSQRRAQAVVRELVQRYRIDGKRLKAFGIGPLAPVATNKTEEGRSKNRRVELVEE